MKLIKNPRGAILTILDFEAWDGLNERLELCSKIKVNSTGETTALFFESVGGSYWETFKKDPTAQIFERPKLGQLSKPDYYLIILDLARSDNQPPTVIKYLIECYELAIKHEKQTKRLEYELKNDLDTSSRKSTKVWQF
jgi:hypothetical protein